MYLSLDPILGHSDILSQFLIDVTSSIAENETNNLVEILGPTFAHLQEKLATISLSDRNLFQYIEILSYFTGSDHLIKVSGYSNWKLNFILSFYQ